MELSERLAIVETKIEDNLDELLKSSRAQHDSIIKLGEGFNSLSLAINHLSELESSANKNSDHILELQKDLSKNISDTQALERKLKGYDTLKDRVITGLIVGMLVALFSMLPIKTFLSLLIGIII